MEAPRLHDRQALRLLDPRVCDATAGASRATRLPHGHPLVLGLLSRGRQQEFAQFYSLVSPQGAKARRLTKSFESSYLDPITARRTPRPHRSSGLTPASRRTGRGALFEQFDQVPLVSK